MYVYILKVRKTEMQNLSRSRESRLPRASHDTLYLYQASTDGGVDGVRDVETAVVELVVEVAARTAAVSRLVHGVQREVPSDVFRVEQPAEQQVQGAEGHRLRRLVHEVADQRHADDPTVPAAQPQFSRFARCVYRGRLGDAIKYVTDARVCQDPRK